jgi:hypothetical protein
LTETPQLWAPWPELGGESEVRRALPFRFPYGIAYTQSAGEILIVAVAHLARRPGYWIDRLDP